MRSKALSVFCTSLTLAVLFLPVSARSEIAAVLNFSKGSYSLGDQGKKVLGDLYERLSQDPALKLSIHGYSDDSGEIDLNLILSRVRAEQAQGYLLRLGLAPERVLEAVGKGPGTPVAGNDSEEGRQRNRRVELLTALSPASEPMAQAELAQTPTAQTTATTPEASPAPAVQASSLSILTATDKPTRFALGIGYPDVRARVALGYGIDAETKVAFDQGFQLYSGRLYWNFLDLGPLMLTAGAEGGYARFDGVETISGSGSLGGGFVGIEYQLGRLRLSVDAGPAWLQASSEGQSHNTTELIYNTALYFYIF